MNPQSAIEPSPDWSWAIGTGIAVFLLIAWNEEWIQPVLLWVLWPILRWIPDPETWSREEWRMAEEAGASTVDEKLAWLKARDRALRDAERRARSSV